MFWIKYSVFTLLSFFVILLFGCSSENNDQQPEENSEVKELSEDEQIKRQVENALDISAAEAYDIQIMYKHINPDTLQDALILVNRKSHAFKRAENNNSERFFENTGYTGPYNHVFVKLGGMKSLISTMAVGSNANFPLKAKFIELTSKAHQDFYVDYRIRNSMQRNYYTVRHDNLFLTFSCPVFDSVGSESPKVYDIQYPQSPVRIAKDIALYQGSFSNYQPDQIEDVNAYEPDGIIGSNDLFVYFIFDDQSMKYMTPMRADE
jgi:hypothetical protein